MIEGGVADFTHLEREEVRKMFQLEDIRKSKVWQEAKGMAEKEIAEVLKIPVEKSAD